MAVKEQETKQGANESQQDSGQSEQSSGGGSRAGTALRVGALAAAAGGAALVAGKAMSGRSSGSNGGEGRETARQNGGSGAGGRASFDKVVQAVGQGRWDVLKDIALPFAENGATSAGTYVAKQGPEILTDRLLPKFIDAFNEERGKSSSSSSAE